MKKIKVILQNNKEFVTEVDNFDINLILQEINRLEISHIAIGGLLINKHHIELIHEIKDEVE